MLTFTGSGTLGKEGGEEASYAVQSTGTLDDAGINRVSYLSSSSLHTMGNLFYVGGPFFSLRFGRITGVFVHDRLGSVYLSIRFSSL